MPARISADASITPMQFFTSFSALGYSAINVTLVFLVIVAIFYRLLRRWLRHPVARIVFGAICVVMFVFTVDFLASENRKLNDAIRSEGGLKRNFPKN